MKMTCNINTRDGDVVQIVYNGRPSASGLLRVKMGGMSGCKTTKMRDFIVVCPCDCNVSQSQAMHFMNSSPAMFSVEVLNVYLMGLAAWRLNGGRGK